MHKKLFICILLSLQLYNAPLCAGQRVPRGSSSSKKIKPVKTWAVVIGISKYKNIEGLNYADKDAQAFYNYLVNTDGGLKLKNGQVQLLLNQKALSNQIYGALDWLRESVKPNDRVIFYFSGHGDVENKSDNPDTQEGFLLAYNAPKAAYKITGAVSVQHLQQFFDDYINQNKAQCVILVADACRAGNLAGGSQGAQLTTQALGKNKNKQIIRILSAQQNEFSFEGTMWGNGRGVFSWYLMKAIAGLANRNNDNQITTTELAAYLPLKVARATGSVQHPTIAGNPQQVLFTFSRQQLQEAKNEKTSPVLTSGSLGIGIAEDITPGIKKLYEKYIDYLQQRKLVWGDTEEDTINCAKTIFLQLLNTPGTEAIRSSLRSSFIAALQQTTQEALDGYTAGAKIVQYNTGEIRYLTTLINPDMVLYNYVMARFYFIMSQHTKTREAGTVLLKKVLLFEPDAPYALNELGDVYNELKMPDSALYCFKKAISVAPRWTCPYVNAALTYGAMKDHVNELLYYRKAMAIDSSDVYTINNLGCYYQRLADYKSALIYHEKALRLDTGFFEATEKQSLAIVYGNIAVDYQNLGYFDSAIANFQMAVQKDSTQADIFLHLGTAYQLLGNYENAILNYKKSIQLDSTSQDGYFSLGLIYQGRNDYVNAMAAFKKAIQIDSTNCTSNIMLGFLYVANNNINQGVPLLQRALKLNPTDQISCYILACAWSDANDTTNSLNCLKKAIENGWQNYNQIMADGNLGNLRKTPEFSQLMKDYFPDKVK